MVGVETIVTPEVEDVAREFEDLVERRDVIGLGFIAVAGAVGVSLANDVVDFVLPRIGMNPDPQTSGDFLAAGLVQLLFAGVLVTVAAAMAGTSQVLFVVGVTLSLGSIIIGGANLFEWGQRTFASFTQESRSASGQHQTRDQGSSRSDLSEQSAVADGGVDQHEPYDGYDPGAPTAATAD